MATSRISAAAYLKKVQGQAKTVNQAQKQINAASAEKSYSVGDTLEADPKVDSGAEAFPNSPNAISQDWRGHNSVLDVLGSMHDAVNQIDAKQTTGEARSVQGRNLRTAANFHLNKAGQMLNNHLNAHAQGDAETSLASLNKALDHIHDAHNVVSQTSSYEREGKGGTSTTGVLSLKNLPSTLGEISRGYINHLKKQGNRGNVPGVTDNVENVRSYTPGVNSPSYLAPSGLEKTQKQGTVAKAKKAEKVKIAGLTGNDLVGHFAGLPDKALTIMRNTIKPHWEAKNPGKEFVGSEAHANPREWAAKNDIIKYNPETEEITGDPYPHREMAKQLDLPTPDQAESYERRKAAGSNVAKDDAALAAKLNVARANRLSAVTKKDAVSIPEVPDAAPTTAVDERQSRYSVFSDAGERSRKF
jgi:hypothetical protein